MFIKKENEEDKDMEVARGVYLWIERQTRIAYQKSRQTGSCLFF